METNENKKTMRFWVLSGIIAMVAAQVPLLMKNKQQEQQQENAGTQQQQKKKPNLKMFIIGAIILIFIIGALVGVILWLFDYLF